MRGINATVQEYGRAPYPAEYLATRKSDGALYMEVRAGKSQSRRFVKPRYVSMKVEVVETFIEKAHELVLR